MTSPPSLGWQKLQDVYYHLRPCYESPQWPFASLRAAHRARVSPHATMVALTPIHPQPRTVDVYTVTGRPVAAIAIPTGHIVDVAFDNENLVVVTSVGRYRYYEDWGGNFTEHGWSDAVALHNAGDAGAAPEPRAGGDSAPDADPPLEVRVLGRLLVLRFRTRLVLSDLAAHASYVLPLGGFDAAGKAHCCDAIGSSGGATGGAGAAVTLLLGYDVSVLSVRADLGALEYEITDEGLTEGPFSQIATLPNALLVLLYNQKDAKVFVINSRFDQVLLEYDAASADAACLVQWCGNDAIVLALDDELRLIGPGQQSISFFYDEAPAGAAAAPLLQLQPDGLKVVSAQRVDFLLRVPEATLNVHQIGLAAPSAILLGCVDKIAQHLPKADTNVQLLQSDGLLALAMTECLQAALEELQPFWQKKLLRAVSFGKVYVDGFSADDYLSTVAALKVLNQIRQPEVAIYITHAELRGLGGWGAVVDMLLKRNMHLLALKVADLVGEQRCRQRVYIHWCCLRISRDLDLSDAALFSVVARKLAGTLVLVEQIAAAALQEGRLDLCKLLVNLEPSVAKRVGALLRLGDVELALLRAFQLADYDLCKTLLLQLSRTLLPTHFFKVLHQNEQRLVEDTSLAEVAADVRQLLREGEPHRLFVHGDLVENFWLELLAPRQPQLRAKYYQVEAAEPVEATWRTATDRRQWLINAINAGSTPRRDVQIYEAQLRLVEAQRRLADTYQQPDFVEAPSAVAVLARLVAMGQNKAAIKVARDLHIAKEKLWYVVLDTCTRGRHFDRLYEFVLLANNAAARSAAADTELKSPIGFKRIVERCLAFKAPALHVAVYIRNCTNIHYTDKIEMHLQNHDRALAAAEAFRFKDDKYLVAIRDRAASDGDAAAVAAAKNYLARL